MSETLAVYVAVDTKGAGVRISERLVRDRDRNTVLIDVGELADPHHDQTSSVEQPFAGNW